MEALLSRKKVSDFRLGLQGGLSIAIGYMPVALTFGLLARTTGLTVAETVLMSMLVFAGAAQYISLSLIAVGTGIIEIILTTFIVNIRHFLMSASLSEKLDEDRLFKKLFFAFGITDETFTVISVKEGRVRTGFVFGVMLISYGSWVVNSGVGYFIGEILPEFLQASMTIALYAMFVGLLVPSMKKSAKVTLLAVTAGALNSVLLYTTNLSNGWSIVTATIVSAIVVELVGLKKGGGRDE
ncbi:AzlC family ABC transporter permease [Bacillus sp. KH172YL63]|uniref:AzlC family ABC transporter permease n=1 Tax=Bacillus sp. KH172YL63 TaxID=2709784 RepID=UPI0013E48917|nr:AzlC family ABC transporter permease [Bacillus sp. KH172YL63]BCB02964.1 autotransporter [Bacillus sp. KH172YL63]